MLSTALLYCQNLLAQDSSASAPADGHAVQFAPRSIEDLNLVGADIHMPPFSDTVLGADSPDRRALYRKGFVLRSNFIAIYTQNTLNPPVPAAQQAYVGERPFAMLMANPILTYDMRAFHLHGAQLQYQRGTLSGSVGLPPAPTPPASTHSISSSPSLRDASKPSSATSPTTLNFLACRSVVRSPQAARVSTPSCPMR